MFRISQCVSCVHYQGQLSGKEMQSCKAFPKGIPDEIWKNEVKHDSAVDGDGGITFERRAPLVSSDSKDAFDL